MPGRAMHRSQHRHGTDHSDPRQACRTVLTSAFGSPADQRFAAHFLISPSCQTLAPTRRTSKSSSRHPSEQSAWPPWCSTGQPVIDIAGVNDDVDPIPVLDNLSERERELIEFSLGVPGGGSAIKPVTLAATVASPSSPRWAAATAVRRATGAAVTAADLRRVQDMRLDLLRGGTRPPPRPAHPCLRHCGNGTESGIPFVNRALWNVDRATFTGLPAGADNRSSEPSQSAASAAR